MHGKFNISQCALANQGRKCLLAILPKLNEMSFNVETQLYIFDTYFASALNYACEVWGFHLASDVEKVNLGFCTHPLGVKKLHQI